MQQTKDTIGGGQENEAKGHQDVYPTEKERAVNQEHNEGAGVKSHWIIASQCFGIAKLTAKETCTVRLDYGATASHSYIGESGNGHESENGTGNRGFLEETPNDPLATKIFHWK